MGFLKERRKFHQEFLDLIFRDMRMDRLHFHRLFLGIVVCGIMFIGYMKLMPVGILLHIVFLAQFGNELESLLLACYRYSF